jgi:SagB-type dehydrogenase family enzyme
MSTGNHIARDYAESVFHRLRRPMEPAGYQPDWTDRPSRYTTYPDAPLIPMEILGPEPPECPLDRLAWLLRMSYGVLAQRTRVDWNQLGGGHTGYPAATWRRGTPSGGGLHPLEIYWVAGSGAGVQPGIYHYAAGHHALERLAVGAFAGPVRRALSGQPDALRTDQFLLVSVRFWKSAFKYASFGYHVATQDLGALLGSWDLLAADLGEVVRRVLWFDDEALNRLLGLDTADESVHAVVPMPWAAAGHPETLHSGRADVVRARAFERSRTVVRFPSADRVHRAGLVGPAPRPAPARPAPAEVAGAATALPPPADLRTGPAGALLSRRRSSFGGLVAAPPLELARLATLLSFAAGARHYRCDLKPDGEAVAWTRLSVLCRQVAGVPAASYWYDARAHALRAAEPGVSQGRLSEILTRRHVLTNYNLELVAAILVISGRLDAMLASYGARGYRMLNAEAGTVAQAGYVAAAALGIGCGAVLGIDNVAMDEALGFAGSDQRSLLFLLIGPERPGRAELDLRLALAGDR